MYTRNRLVRNNCRAAQREDELASLSTAAVADPSVPSEKSVVARSYTVSSTSLPSDYELKKSGAVIREPGAASGAVACWRRLSQGQRILPEVVIR
jgi:hypothetical protein